MPLPFLMMDVCLFFAALPEYMLWVKWAPFPIIPNQDSHLKLLTGNSGPIRMVAAISRKAEQLVGQGSTTPAQATLTWLNQTVLV